VEKLVSAHDGAEIMDEEDVQQVLNEEKKIMVLGPDESWQGGCNPGPCKIPPAPAPLIISKSTFENYRLPGFSAEVLERLNKNEDIKLYLNDLFRTVIFDMRLTTTTISYIACRNVVANLKEAYPASFEKCKHIKNQTIAYINGRGCLHVPSWTV
jgi:hypothetical protein